MLSIRFVRIMWIEMEMEIDDEFLCLSREY